MDGLTGLLYKNEGYGILTYVTKEIGTVDSGGSFGASSLTQHIGLGKAKSIDTLEIRWAGSNIKQIVTDLEINTLHQIVEQSEQTNSRTPFKASNALLNTENL